MAYGLRAHCLSLCQGKLTHLWRDEEGHRKNKYFKENKTLIQSAEAHDGKEGFELRLVVGNMEDLTIEQTAD